MNTDNHGWDKDKEAWRDREAWREMKREWRNAKHEFRHEWQNAKREWTREHQARHHWHGHGMQFKGWWIWGAIFIGFLAINGAFRGGWWVWMLIPFFFWFVMPKMRHMSRGGWHGSHGGYEKRKHDDDGDFDDDKPKNSPTYFVGDDGELFDPREGYPRKPKRDDGIEYV